jgi:hypothetical protein
MKEDAYMVQDNLRMITWDMVADPSCQNAFPQLVEHKKLVDYSRSHPDKVDPFTSEKIYLEALRRILR